MDTPMSLVVCAEPNTSSETIASGALRSPTPLDWELWKPMMKAYYSTVPARLLVKDMNDVGLKVT